MDSASNSRASAPIRYRLTPRIATDGRVSITLQLYRGNTVASTSPVATVAQRDAAEVMHKCKLRFATLGVEGMPHEALGVSRASLRETDRALSSISPATRLKFRTK
jgi:hypothetical protein